MKKLCIFFLLYIQTMLSDEYMYPIANLNDTMILMMHQKSIDDLELLALDTVEKTTQKMLSALYFPAHVALLPHKNSYSFIDRGRIYIKELLKRTPRVLDIQQPICDIQSLQWINDHQCVFSARLKNHYKIFMYDISTSTGQLYSLCSLNDTINYIFPSTINHENLFCLVQKNGTEMYQIAHMKINPIAWDRAIHDSSSSLDFTILQIFHQKPLCFLKMVDQHFGYVIELTEHNHEEKMFTFTAYNVLIKESKLEKLFDFTIPEYFIIGMSKERFYESLNPLLPYYQDDLIYFTSFDTVSEKLKVYMYDFSSKTISLYNTHKFLQNQHVFAPMKAGDQLLLGSSK